MSVLKELIDISKPVEVDINILKPYPKKSRKQNPEAMKFLNKSLDKLGVIRALICNKNNEVLAGTQLLFLLKKKGVKKWYAVYPKVDLTEEQEKSIIIADNSNSFRNASNTWDEDLILSDYKVILEDFELGEDEFVLEEVNIDSNQYKDNNSKKGSLSERFLLPPFSILDARNPNWQDRKKFWLDLGIRSNHGRKDDLLKNGGLSDLAQKLSPNTTLNGTSVFDPVLCEIIYSWFTKEGDVILDPFAGGSVRGIVAGALQRNYYGIDLREEQIEANIDNLQTINLNGIKNPCWLVGDSCDIDVISNQNNIPKSNFLFSCPPYGDLEVYSDKENDLSNLKYSDFICSYKNIIKKSFNLLQDNSFACFIVGDFRDEKGFYRNFVSNTIDAFCQAGFQYYNEAILITSYGTLPYRVARQFQASRKLGKTHQNILIFIKGDYKKACIRLGEVKILDFDENSARNEVK